MSNGADRGRRANRRRRVPHRAALVVGLVLGVGSAAPLALLPTQAAGASGVTPTTFTWTGRATLAKTPDYDWSDADNWQGDVAPTAPGPVDLVFPALTCTVASRCDRLGASYNDISGLTVGTLTVHTAGATCGSPALSYTIDGDAITLTTFVGTLTSTSGQCATFPVLGLPITVAGTPTWSMDGSQAIFSGRISGAVPLTLSVENGGTFDLEATDQVGTVTVQGVDRKDTGAQAFANGGIFVPFGSSVNAGGPGVVVNEAGVYALGILGPLTTSGAAVAIGNGVSPYGELHVDDAVTLDARSQLSLYDLTPGSATPPAPVAGTDYPQLDATGTAALGSAELFVAADCDQPLGTVYTLVHAAQLSGSLRWVSGGRIGTGTVEQATAADDPSCATAGAAPPYLRFTVDDAAGTVTATVVKAPTTSSIDHAPQGTGPAPTLGAPLSVVPDPGHPDLVVDG